MKLYLFAILGLASASLVSCQGTGVPSGSNSLDPAATSSVTVPKRPAKESSKSSSSAQKPGALKQQIESFEETTVKRRVLDVGTIPVPD